MAYDILIVDDEKDIRDLISDVLKDEGYETRVANDSCSAIDAIDERLPSALVLDIWLQGSQMDGLGILEAVKSKFPNLPVIMISGHGNIETAISSIKLGAYDYLEKPFKEDKLIHLINRAIETAKLKDENEQLKLRGTPESHLIGVSPAVRHLNNTIEKVAATSSRVLITGPAGSGKEVVARLVHKKSKRADGPFVILNAASISSENVEEVLFGSGSSQGFANSNRKLGTFEKAHGGTLFIDEVADMPLATQGKILRILQDNSFERLGSDKKVKVDVRVIAATNRDLQKEIAENRFREDLYYRLNVFPITVPPLQERRQDISLLVNYFVKRSADILGVTPRKIADEAMAAMEAYYWPGNVRQLRNVVEWLLIMAPEDQRAEMNVDLLPPDIVSQNPLATKVDSNADLIAMPLRAAREVFEKQYLLAQLQRFDGNISRTASFVGMERSALHRKLKSLGITGEETGESNAA